LIATPNGRRKICELAVGDPILSYDPVERSFTTAKVGAIYRSRGEVRTVRTTRGELGAVTESHPVFVAARGFAPVASLTVEDAMLFWDGGDAPELASIVEIVPAAPGDTVEVFDLTIEGAYPAFFADGFLVHNKSPIGEPPGPQTNTSTNVVDVARVVERGETCPALCGPTTAERRVDACSLTTSATGPARAGAAVEATGGDACPKTAPAEFAPCDREAIVCVWPRTGDWCAELYGTCKGGVWRTSACGAPSTIAPAPDVCPTAVVPLNSLSACRAGVEQRCLIKTDSAVCPEVEAFCVDGTWKVNSCRSGGSYVAVTCTITSGLTGG
jgi:hypothetical protein